MQENITKSNVTLQALKYLEIRNVVIDDRKIFMVNYNRSAGFHCAYSTAN